MSTAFELDDEGWQKRVADSRYQHADINTEATFGQGALSGLSQGVMRGFASAGHLFGTVETMGAAGMTKLVASTLDPEHADDYSLEEMQDQGFRSVDDLTGSAIRYWTPSREDVGSLGRALGGLGEAGAEVIAGGGTPYVVVGANTLNTGEDMVREGVDANTAGVSASLSGLTTYAGFKLPFFGSTLASKMATGAIGNTLFGGLSTEAQHELLKVRGYDQLAANYDPLDGGARVTDFLVGALFGAVDFAHSTPEDRMHIGVLNNAKHFQESTAPGTPKDVIAAGAHQRAMSTAFDQVMKGDQVSVNPEVTHAEFTPRPSIPTKEVQAAAREVSSDIPEARPPEEIDTSPAAIEQRFRERIKNNPEGAMQEYAKLPETDGGRILNTDAARELSPDYRADRTRSSAVHEPASDLVKQMYVKKLAEKPAAGQEPVVVFSAGGTGAGKTVGLRAAAESSESIARAQIIYDTNMSSLKSAVDKIEQALAASKDVHIVYTWRDPVEALTNGALPRAERMGRTVPLEEHVKTHVGAAEVMREIAAKYAQDDRVSITAVDNSRGRGNSRPMDIEKVPALDYNSVRGEVRKALEAERQAGRISEAVYRGTADAQATGREAGAGDRGGSQPGQAPSINFESRGPGDPFLALRVSKIASLENGNAGDPRAIATFLARIDDAERPQPVGAEVSDTLHVFEVTPEENFGKYALGSKGKMVAGAVGRQSGRDGTSYSFPAGSKYRAREVAAIPLKEIRAEAAKRAGSESFDDIGSNRGSKVLEDVIRERLAGAPKETPETPKAEEPAGETDPVVAAVDEHLDREDIRVPTGEIDAEGNMVVRSGREIMAAAKAAVQQAKEMAKAVEAAVGCFLTRGMNAS